MSPDFIGSRGALFHRWGLDSQRGKWIFRVTQWACLLEGGQQQEPGLYPQSRPVEFFTPCGPKVVGLAGRPACCLGFQGDAVRCVHPGQVAQSFSSLLCLGVHPSPTCPSVSVDSFSSFLTSLLPETFLSESSASPQEGVHRKEGYFLVWGRAC